MNFKNLKNFKLFTDFNEKKRILNNPSFKKKLKYKNLLSLKNKINKLKKYYPDKCYYCDSLYIVTDIHNIDLVERLLEHIKILKQGEQFFADDPNN